MEKSRKMEHYHYFQQMVYLESELEQEEVDEMERQMELEQEELVRTIDDYQEFHEMVERELEQEEIDQLEQREKERENEIEMERQMELEEEDQDRRIDDYQNFHELAGLDVELEQEEIDQMEQNEKEREKDLVTAPPVGTRVSFFKRSLLEPNSARLSPGPEGNTFLPNGFLLRKYSKSLGETLILIPSCYNSPAHTDYIGNHEAYFVDNLVSKRF